MLENVLRHNYRPVLTFTPVHAELGRTAPDAFRNVTERNFVKG